MELIALTVAALLVGFLCGMGRSRTPGQGRGRREADKPHEQPQKAGKRRLSASKLIALAVLLVDGSATYIVLYLCWLAIVRDYAGALPYLTTLIGALQAVTGVVLTAYYHKAKAENTKGGITYDAALGVSAAEQWNGTVAGTAGDAVPDSDTDL